MLVMSSSNAFVKSYIPGSHCDFLRAIASMKMCGVLKVVYTGNGRRSQWCHGPTIFGPFGVACHSAVSEKGAQSVQLR